MYTDMDLYAKVRRAVMVDAMNERAVARNFGISRNTAKSIPPHTSQAVQHHTARPPPTCAARRRVNRVLNRKMLGPRYSKCWDTQTVAICNCC